MEEYEGPTHRVSINSTLLAFAEHSTLQQRTGILLKDTFTVTDDALDQKTNLNKQKGTKPHETCYQN